MGNEDFVQLETPAQGRNGTVIQDEAPQPRRRGVSFVQIIIVWVALSILAVNIAILYVIHYADKPSTPSYTAVGSDSFATANGTGLDSLNEGTPVSVNDDGTIAVGAGTSFYLGPYTFADNSAKYIQNNALTNNTMLVSYYTGTTTMFNITTVDARNPRALTSAVAGSLKLKVMRSIPVSSTLVILIASNATTKFGTPADPVNNILAIPAVVSGTELDIQTAKGVVVNPTLGTSISLGASKMSSSQMAVTLYGVDSAGSNGLFVTILNINGDALSATKPQFYADNSDFNTTLSDPVGLGQDQFFLPYYNGTGLCAIYGSVDSGNIKLQTPGCLSSVAPKNFMTATTLEGASTTRVAIAFSDSAQSNAIRVVDVDKYLTGIPTFGSLYTVDNGNAFANVDGAKQLYYQLNIGNVGPNRVLVAYSDMANQGIITGQVLTVTAISGFLPITAPMPMSAPITTTGTYVFKEITYLGNSRFSLVYTYSLDGKISQGAYVIGEVFPTPLGVVGDDSNVLVSGAANFPDASFKLGVSYYTNTVGELIQGRRYGDTYPYATSTDGKTVVSHDSYIGVAADSTTLVLNR